MPESTDPKRSEERSESPRAALARFCVRFSRANSMTGQPAEIAYSRPIHAYSLEHARDIGWDCATYRKLLAQDQRWTIDAVFPMTEES